MLTSGDVVDLDLGPPTGREAGFLHPAVVLTAQPILDADPNVIHVVPLTTTVRAFGSEIAIEADEINGLDDLSAAQCQHIRSVSVSRAARRRGNVGPAVLLQIRETVGLLLDIR
jgi:mRNA interferase MazF